MALYDSVCSPDTTAIQISEWELHAVERRPVGVCQDCGADLFGEKAERDYGRIYRNVRCRHGHERTIPGPYYKGTIVPRPDTLPFEAPRHLRAVPDTT